MSEEMLTIKSKMLSAFKCQQSGNCCRCPGIVYVTQSEVESMAAIKNLSVIKFKEIYVKRQNGWEVVASTTFRKDCFLNKKNQCDVYGARPKQCRTYPNWPEIWESKEAIIKETKLCPGFKKAFETIFPD
jgi:uncharacterized protein